MTFSRFCHECRSNSESLNCALSSHLPTDLIAPGAAVHSDRLCRSTRLAEFKDELIGFAADAGFLDLGRVIVRGMA